MSQNILFIIDGLPGGGAERVVLTLAEGMLAQGHKVTLISLRDVCHYSLPVGLNYQVVADQARGPLRKLGELRRHAKQLDHAITQLQTNLGHFDRVFSNLPKTDRVVTHCRSLQPQQLWFCIHNMLSISYLEKKQGFARWWKRWRMARTYQHKQLIAVSQAVLDNLCQEFAVVPAAQKVIYNPFDLDSIRQHAAAPCALDGEDFLLHVGRLHPQKRHDRLLDAYAQSGLSQPLVLLGNGSDEAVQAINQQAEQLGIREKVHYLGFQDNPYRYLRAARALVLSSDCEGFGNVLVEALACQTQVISSPCPGGPKEILVGDLQRGLANDMSAAALANAMREIVAHPVDLSTVDLSRFTRTQACEQYLAC